MLHDGKRISPQTEPSCLTRSAERDTSTARTLTGQQTRPRHSSLERYDSKRCAFIQELRFPQHLPAQLTAPKAASSTLPQKRA